MIILEIGCFVNSYMGVLKHLVLGLVPGLYSSFMEHLAFVMGFLFLPRVTFRLDCLAGIALSV